MAFKTSERDKDKQAKPHPEEAPEHMVRAPKYARAPEKIDEDPVRPKVAVILGSKGVEAFASLPLLNLLDKSGIHVNLVIGCSGGGVMAALWSAGYNLKQIQHFFSHFFTKDAFSLPDAEELMRLANDNYSPERGIYNTSAQFKAYQKIFNETRIENLSPKTIFHATDIRTGTGVTIEKGPVAPAIQACGALYPIMAPVEINGRLLADGSYTMPLPVIEAVNRNMDLILVSYADSPLDPSPGTLLSSFINISRITSASLRGAQFFSSVNMHNYEICFAPVPLKEALFPWDVQHIPKIVSAGKIAAQDVIPDFVTLYGNFTKYSERKHTCAENRQDTIPPASDPSSAPDKT